MSGVRFDGNTSVVSFVVKGGPADKAGILIGDEILSVGESFVVQPNDLMTALKNKRAGDVVVLEIKRGSEVRFFELSLIDAVEGDVVIGEDGAVSPLPKLGILNELAPELTVEQWYDIPEGASARLKDNRGKVVCMLLFQTDCEFSLRRGLPQFKAVQDEFSDDPQVFMMAIQTPFRNFDDNTHGAAIQLFNKLNLKGPLGHDGSAQRRTVTYDVYKAYGTPWFIVLDKNGIVHFNDSTLPIKEARKMFGNLKTAQTESPKEAAESPNEAAESPNEAASESESGKGVR